VSRNTLGVLLRRALLVRQDCAYCDATLSLYEYGASYATIDHIVPRRDGGTRVRANLALACRACNDRKSHSREWPAPTYTLADILPVATVGSANYYDDPEDDGLRSE